VKGNHFVDNKRSFVACAAGAAGAGTLDPQATVALSAKSRTPANQPAQVTRLRIGFQLDEPRHRGKPRRPSSSSFCLNRTRLARAARDSRHVDANATLDSDPEATRSLLTVCRDEMNEKPTRSRVPSRPQR
jgi:hypothetical protein